MVLVPRMKAARARPEIKRRNLCCPQGPTLKGGLRLCQTGVRGEDRSCVRFEDLAPQTPLTPLAPLIRVTFLPKLP
jgi:hypothetical protein